MQKNPEKSQKPQSNKQAIMELAMEVAIAQREERTAKLALDAAQKAYTAAERRADLAAERLMKLVGELV